MIKLEYSTLLQIEKYVNLDEGIQEVAPELLQQGEAALLVQQLKQARENLYRALKEGASDETR